MKKHIIFQTRKISIAILLLLIGGFAGYSINQSFKVNEFRQINLLHSDISDYISEQNKIIELKGQVYTLAKDSLNLQCASDTVCFGIAVNMMGKLSGELKAHEEALARLKGRINERYRSIWLTDFLKINLDSKTSTN